MLKFYLFVQIFELIDKRVKIKSMYQTEEIDALKYTQYINLQILQRRLGVWLNQ